MKYQSRTKKKDTLKKKSAYVTNQRLIVAKLINRRNVYFNFKIKID